MMKIINPKTVEAEPLDEARLWALLNATRNHVHTEIEFKSGRYEIEVFFKNSSGSSIFAKASDTDRLRAMARCLSEIERLW